MTRRRTRRAMVCGAVPMAGGVLATVACARARGTGEGPPVGVPGPARLLASNWVDHSAAVQAYAQEFPQITVEYTPAGGTGPHYEKVQTSAVAGTPLDAFWLHDAMVTQLVGNGMVQPLDDLVKRDKEALDDIYPVALKYHTRDGKLYGIPQNLSIYMIYYDQDRFAEVGLPLPAADWTLEAWLEAATRLTRSGTERAGVTLQTDTRGYWMFLKAHGGAWLDETGTRSRLADPETIAGVQFIKDLLDRQKVAMRPAAGTREWVQLQERQAGMLVALNSEAAWNLRRANLPFRWDLAEPPKGPKGRGTAQAATAWVAGQGGKHPDAAWHFVKWMTAEKAQRLLAAQNALVASRKRVVEDATVTPPPPANLKATSNAHGYADFFANPAVVLPDPEKVTHFNAALGAALGDVFADRVPVRDALTAADTLLKQQGVVK
ncbi:MAG TPA: sugar ABC transporter substrate-binding protein [Chloroflexota bacterium]|nr:sugar ABC transporter substrate-binding protein [Chloroflexota bacterium]